MLSKTTVSYYGALLQTDKELESQLLDFSERERELLLVPHPSELMSLAVHDSITDADFYFPNSNILYFFTS